MNILKNNKIVKKTYYKKNTHLVFHHFSHLTVTFFHFRFENQIPGAKLCILAAGMVWNREIWSKHEEIDFLDFYFPLFSPLEAVFHHF